MESLDNILKKINTSKANTDISSGDEENDVASRCSLCQGRGWLAYDVPYGHPDFGKIVPCKCKEAESTQNRLARLERYSNLGGLTRNTFETLIEEGRSGDPRNQELFKKALNAAKSYAKNPSGWLVLTGSSGCGKTHLAAAIANARLQAGYPALFIVVPDLLDHLRSTYSPSSEISYDELFNQIQDAPLLILDDLGVQSSTPWAQEKMFQIINHRFNSLAPTVFTTNLMPEELPERLRTRLTDETLSNVYIVGKTTSSYLVDINPLELALLKSMSFENFDYKRLNLPAEQRQNLNSAYQLAYSFAKSPAGWLIFVGTHGCGKTHLAAAIANYRLQAGYPVEFQVVPEFLDHLRLSFSPERRMTYDSLFERIKKAPLLILDDFGAQTSTEWAQEKLYQLINYRYNARLATVATTVLSPEQIEDRLCSRMLDSQLSIVFNIMAPDYRTDREPVAKSQPKPGRRTTRNI